MSAITNNQTFQNIKNTVTHAASTTMQVIYKTPPQILAFAVAGAALKVLGSPIGNACLAIAGADLATRLVVKLSESRHPDCLKGLLERAAERDKKYPMLKLAMVIGVLVLSTFNPRLGLIMGIHVGVFNGLAAPLNDAVSALKNSVAEKTGFVDLTKKLG